jgi:Flp pilus assembly pilin Flp
VRRRKINVEMVTMFAMLERFCGDEDGAVTVDFVVLTAAVVGVAIVVMVPIKNSAAATSTVIASTITSAQNTTTP